MFDVLPNLISSLLTVLFPIFASYKALRTSDPAQLTPWLMYWVVFSCFTLFESWTWFILSWLPFYAYFRLLLLSYLVLPQTQGARLLYQSYIHPFLAQHEAEIDTLISHAHDRARSAGLQYLKRAIDFVRENVFGAQPKKQSHVSSAGEGGTYAQNLLSRFNLPSAREGLAAPAGDFYGLLSATMSQVGSGSKSLGSNSNTSREAQIDHLFTTLPPIPQTITSPAEKLTFLTTQREKLRLLLSALDQQTRHLETEEGIERDVEGRMGAGRGGLEKSRSEAEFDAIEREEASGRVTPHNRKSSGGGGGGSWMPWAWGAKPNEGSSTGLDRGT